MKQEVIGSPAVLVADDDPNARELFSELLTFAGYDVSVAASGEQSRALAADKRFDAVLSDISMPGLSGLQLLQAIRVYDLDVPVLLITGNPSIETAAQAVEYGAMKYMIKPASNSEILDSVSYAVRLCRVARAQRLLLGAQEDGKALVADIAGLEAVYSPAFDGLYMAYQPIVEASTGDVFAYEALLRSESPVLRGPTQVIDAAERLGRLEQLGQRIRELVASTIQRIDTQVFFMNLHPRDLLDPALYNEDAPISLHAHRVVTEITERASLDDVKGAEERIRKLRKLGYRIAVDDLGSGYASLNAFLSLRPDYTKIDMAIVRDIDTIAAKQKVVSAIVDLSNGLQAKVVAEGIETDAERDTCVRLGVDLLQGFALGRPQPL